MLAAVVLMGHTIPTAAATVDIKSQVADVTAKVTGHVTAQVTGQVTNCTKKASLDSTRFEPEVKCSYDRFFVISTQNTHSLTH